MKTLHVFLVSLFAFQALLFASAATEARRLLTVESWSTSWLMKAGFERRHRPPRQPPSPPPPPGYSPGPGPGPKLKSPPSPYTIRGSTYPPRRRSPPPPPCYSPGPTPKHSSPPRPFIVIASLPATSEHAPALKDFVYEKSPPNPFAASA